jgi:AhpD family alkylhydroperoxidase
VSALRNENQTLDKETYMQTIRPVQMEDASEATRRIYETVNAAQGGLSNMVKTMGHSPSVLEGYVQFNGALNGGKLTAKLREQVALTVAQADRCEYSLAQHAERAGRLGLTQDEIASSREARAVDTKTDVALKFARDLATRSEYSTLELRQAGFDDGEIMELIAQVGLNWFENYVTKVARTDLDFPVAGVRGKAA